jgi:hypothetical protein
MTIAPIQLWKWQMYISQNLRQSWYGNMLGEDSGDEDQDAMKVTDRSTSVVRRANLFSVQ